MDTLKQLKVRSDLNLVSAIFIRNTVKSYIIAQQLKSDRNFHNKQTNKQTNLSGLVRLVFDIHGVFLRLSINSSA